MTEISRAIGPREMAVALRGIASWALCCALSGCAAGGDDDFAGRIVPILEQRCAGANCHGTLPGEPHALDPKRWLTFSIDHAGRIADLGGARASLEGKINSTEKPALSTLLRKTLPVQQGGLLHFQSAIFASRDDADYRTLEAWVSTVTTGTEGATEPPLTEREQLFASKVYPFLIDRGCATATCHGSLMFGGAVFHTPAIPGTHELPRTELRATIGEARRNLTMWGDPGRSRLLAKILPLDKGGIPHKGGNDVFFSNEAASGDIPASETYKGIAAWIQAEREVELGATPMGFEDAWKSAPPIVFVGGPVQRGDPFDFATHTPGTDLYRLDPPYTGPPVNLTAALHGSPVEIRDPAVSHDGQTIVFAMRRSLDDAMNIYTIGANGDGLVQVTTDASAVQGGLVVTNRQPVFGPNGGFTSASGQVPNERIYFVSTRALEQSDMVSVQNADLYAMDADGANVERLTWTIVPELAPAFVSVGEFAGTMVYTIKRSAEGGHKAVFFRFPIDHNRDFHIQPEAHPHFGMSEAPQVFYRIRETVDGRAAMVLLDENNRWRGGQLALIDRQFAVELPEGQEAGATVPSFRHALTILTPEAAREGPSADGLWMDPLPMPDGTIVAAHAQGPIDLADPDGDPKPSLVRLTIADGKTNPTQEFTARPKIVKADLLFDDAMLPATQPVALVPRGTEDPPHPRAWGGDIAKAAPQADIAGMKVPTALLVHSGVQVIEALIAQLPPMAKRAIRDDLSYVRAVVPVQVAASLLGSATAVESVPAGETRAKREGATNQSLTGRAPLFAIEVPPATDGSLAVHIPANVPVRLVTLDADRVATGALQHHWYAPLPGERFPVGIPLYAYAARCGGCHGAMDGNPQTVLQPPTDFITQASVTASLYHDNDRRQPRVLPVVDASLFTFVDFRQHVQPILDAKCATSGCHGGPAPAGGLSLTPAPTQHYNDAYESLLAPGEGSAHGYRYVDADGYRARGSYLAERIMAREYEAPRAYTGSPCPPAGSPALTGAEKQTLLRWIELGAAWIGAPAPAK